MQTRGGCGDGARIFGKYGLVALAVRRLVGAIDIGRERHVSEPIQMLANVAVVMRNESQRSQPQFPTRQDLAVEFTIPKQNTLSDMHFSAGPNQRFPGVGSELTGKKDFNSAAEMLGAWSAGRRLRMNPGSFPEQPGRDDPCIVEHQQFVAAKKIG